ncbi:Trans-golgi network protein 2 [Nesidiocoris tenuis]|uniref:Trans-golgi network protein 2 n=1 Tax=Nesidiocoris tenuis TaxID=355587 RepID=A0ABN7AIL2_9HEMI|nr:Trans-golgi network protein 2 [Nesidiocoris tenuis]
MAPFFGVVLLLWQVSESFSFLGGPGAPQKHVNFIPSSDVVLGANCTNFRKQMTEVVPKYCADFIRPNDDVKGIVWVQAADEAQKQGVGFDDTPHALFCFGLYDAHAELCSKNQTFFRNITLSPSKYPEFTAPKFCNTTNTAFKNYRIGLTMADKIGDSGSIIRNAWATALRDKLSNWTFCEHYCVFGVNLRAECVKIAGALLLKDKASAASSSLLQHPAAAASNSVLQHPAAAAGVPLHEVQQMAPSPPNPEPVYGRKSSSTPLGPSDSQQKPIVVDTGAKAVVKSDIVESVAQPGLESPVQNQDSIAVQPPRQAASTDDENKPVQETNKQVDNAPVEAPRFGEGPEIGGEPEQGELQPLDDQNQQEGNDEQPDGLETEQAKQPKGVIPVDQGLSDNTDTLVLKDKNDDDSNLMTNFLLMFGGALLLCIAFCNKKKLLALALEGRRTHRRGDRHHTASYSKLHSNLEEAIVSGPTSPSTTHVLY